MQYEMYGPIPVPRKDKQVDLSRDVKKQFWKDVEEEAEGLSEAMGVYAFSIKYDGRLTPWYVGQKRVDKGFKQEFFTTHKF